MKIKTKLSFGVLSLGLLLVVAGLAYWIVSENSQTPQRLESAQSRSSVSVPLSPPALPAAAPPSHATPTPAPPSSVAAAPPASPTTAPQAEATPAPAPPSSVAATSGASSTLLMPAEADMSEADRRRVQEALHRLGYYRGPVDGIFGPLTRVAIRHYQGTIGAKTTGNLTAEEASQLIETH